MTRFLGGVAAALLLVAAGFFIWRSQAERESMVPSAPAGRLLAVPAQPDEEGDEAPAADKSREEKRFARYDKDGNGKVSRAEMLESRRTAFVKLDKDGNGSLSFEEWAVKTAEKFAGADTDHDGVLTPTEFAVTAPKRKPKPKCTC